MPNAAIRLHAARPRRAVANPADARSGHASADVIKMSLYFYDSMTVES